MDDKTKELFGLAHEGTMRMRGTKKKYGLEKLNDVFDQDKRIDRLENLLLSLADACQDDSITGKDILIELKKHGVI